MFDVHRKLEDKSPFLQSPPPKRFSKLSASQERKHRSSFADVTKILNLSRSQKEDPEISKTRLESKPAFLEKTEQRSKHYKSQDYNPASQKERKAPTRKHFEGKAAGLRDSRVKMRNAKHARGKYGSVAGDKSRYNIGPGKTGNSNHIKHNNYSQTNNALPERSAKATNFQKISKKGAILQNNEGRHRQPKESVGSQPRRSGSFKEMTRNAHFTPKIVHPKRKLVQKSLSRGRKSGSLRKKRRALLEQNMNSSLLPSHLHSFKQLKRNRGAQNDQQNMTRGKGTKSTANFSNGQSSNLSQLHRPRQRARKSKSRERKGDYSNLYSRSKKFVMSGEKNLSLKKLGKGVDSRYFSRERMKQKVRSINRSLQNIHRQAQSKQVAYLYSYLYFYIYLFLYLYLTKSIFGFEMTRS